jgi:hypothetical protein
MINSQIARAFLQPVPQIAPLVQPQFVPPPAVQFAPPPVLPAEKVPAAQATSPHGGASGGPDIMAMIQKLLGSGGDAAMLA